MIQGNAGTSLALATAWNPRGELARLEALLPALESVYQKLVISVPPNISEPEKQALNRLVGDGLVVTKTWSHGRHAALGQALLANTSHIHYVDGDRLIRWVETRSAEWRKITTAVQKADCLVIGRTPTAWDTHPQAIRQTERITNTIFSGLLEQSLDFSAGSKGFSRQAAALILANSAPGHALGTDAEWIVLVHRAGFKIQSILVDGLDWEIADRYQATAADIARQRKVAATYDADAACWTMRVNVAVEIAEAGMAALTRSIITPSQNESSPSLKERDSSQ